MDLLMKCCSKAGGWGFLTETTFSVVFSVLSHPAWEQTMNLGHRWRSVVLVGSRFVVRFYFSSISFSFFAVLFIKLHEMGWGGPCIWVQADGGAALVWLKSSLTPDLLEVFLMSVTQNAEVGFRSDISHHVETRKNSDKIRHLLNCKVLFRFACHCVHPCFEFHANFSCMFGTFFRFVFFVHKPGFLRQQSPAFFTVRENSLKISSFTLKTHIAHRCRGSWGKPKRCRPDVSVKKRFFNIKPNGRF